MITQVSGTRRMTEQLAQVRVYASRYHPGACTRGAAIGAVKQARKGLGLTISDIGVLDALFATSQPQDWIDGTPIVWPSNDELMEMTGLSLASVKRHLRVLINVGLICPKDSPTGQRSGRRDADGRIIKAYGFALSPIAARYVEIREIASYDRIRKTMRRDLEREWTMLRKDVARIVASGLDCGLVGDWHAYGRQLADLIECKAARQPLPGLIEKLRDLADHAEEAYKVAHMIDEQDITPTGVISEPPILTTTNLDICKCNQRMSDANAPQVDIWAVSDGRRPPNEAAAGGDVEQTGNSGQHRVTEPTVLPGYVSYACPSLEAYGHRPRDWADIFDVTNKLRPGLGISEPAWHDAISTLGPQSAALALAVIIEKTGNGEITNPGGYLRGMTAKARDGKLNLDRSIHGLAAIRNSQQ